MTELYTQKRYRTDEEFREKQKKQAKSWRKDNPEQLNKTYREWYANRIPEQIAARKEYLKKHRGNQKMNSSNKMLQIEKEVKI